MKKTKVMTKGSTFKLLKNKCGDFKIEVIAVIIPYNYVFFQN